MKNKIYMLSNENFNRWGESVLKLYNEYRENETPIEAEVLRHMINGNYKIWVSLSGTRDIQGFIMLGVYNAPSYSTLELVYSDKECRRNGIGKSLIERAMLYSKRKKFSFVDLYRDKNNKLLEKLYKSFGFTNEPYDAVSTRMIKIF